MFPLYSRESIVYILPNSAATQKLENIGEEEQIWARRRDECIFYF